MSTPRLFEITSRELEFARPIRTAAASVQTRATLLVRLIDVDDTFGYGECAPWPAATDADAEALRTACTQWACGEVTNLQGPVGAAIATAQCDIEARRAGEPLAQFLARYAAKPTPLASLPVNAVLDADTDNLDAIGGGFRVVKCKVGADDAAHDVARLRRLAAQARTDGRSVRFRLDANGGWSPRTAIEVLTRLADDAIPIEFVEQPVAPDDLAGMAAVRAAVPYPVFADEAVLDVDSLERLVAADACDGVMLKIARCGGPLAAGAVASAAQRHGLLVAWSSSFESAIGMAAGIHTAMAFGTDAACGFAATGVFTNDVAPSAARTVGFDHVTPHTGPGLGVWPHDDR